MRRLGTESASRPSTIYRPATDQPKAEGSSASPPATPGFRFTDGEPVKTFRCDVKQPWTPSHVVPDCVTEETQQAAYNVVAKVLYRAATPSVPATCLSQYSALVRPFYQALDRALSARCSAISVDMNVTFVETEMHLVEDNIAEITYVLSVTPAVRQPQLYDLCGSTLGLVFDLSVPSTSAVLSPLLDLAAANGECPSMKAVNSSLSRGFACGVGEVLNMPAAANVPRCLHCPAGTSAVSGAKNCALCPRGSYQDQERSGSCKRCPAGTFTRSEGSKTVDECVPVCGFGTYSPTGLARALCAPRRVPDAGLQRMILPADCACPKLTRPSATARPDSLAASAKSTSTFGDYRCLCALGFTSKKCQHGETCSDSLESFQYQCRSGFTGALWENKINEGAPVSPCLNGGACAELVNNFKCTFPAGNDMKPSQFLVRLFNAFSSAGLGRGAKRTSVSASRSRV